jgi:hypothetical protein
MFEEPKSPFEEKKNCLIKKLKALIKVQKAKKISKGTFSKSLKLKLLPKKTFFFFFLLKSCIFQT